MVRWNEEDGGPKSFGALNRERKFSCEFWIEAADHSSIDKKYKRTDWVLRRKWDLRERTAWCKMDLREEQLFGWSRFMFGLFCCCWWSDLKAFQQVLTGDNRPRDDRLGQRAPSSQSFSNMKFSMTSFIDKFGMSWSMVSSCLVTGSNRPTRCKCCSISYLS